MKIVIKQLELTNFKVIRHILVDFKEKTNIYGRNGLGKTTLKDAFLWLLFGKDSTNRKDFAIKTLDSNNKPYHNLDHEVGAVLDVDGETISIKRSLREKWVKKRGELTPEFQGHETFFFWNDVPCQLKEFQQKVDKLVSEDLFRLITSTGYFNALEWKQRRSTLLSITGTISNDEVVAALKRDGHTAGLEILINALAKGKSADELKREISNKIKTIKNELELIPSRIDEANRSLPDPVDYSATEKMKAAAEKDLENIEHSLLDKTRAAQQFQNARTEKVRQQGTLRQSIQQIEFQIANQVKDAQQTREQQILAFKRDLSSQQNGLHNLNAEIARGNNKINDITTQQQRLREQWAAEDKKTLLFNENELSCPACKRAYEAANVEEKKEELTRNFNQSKSEKLNQIVADGQKLGADLEAVKTAIRNLEASLKSTEGVIASLVDKIANAETEHSRLAGDEAAEITEAIADNLEHQKATAQINSLEIEINTKEEEEDNTELLNQKRTLITEIDGYKAQLGGKEQRQRILNRITELKNQESEMAQEVATLEGTEFTIEKFTKARMDELEKRINSRFAIVKFKMFEEQINGGLQECCEALIDGVPFSDANTASRINAGLDIINTLCEHYNVTAPIFIDNRESVISLIPTDSQIINLRVSENDDSLRIDHVEHSEMALA